MRQTACLVFNPITFENYAALFRCPAVVQASDSDGFGVKLQTVIIIIIITIIIIIIIIILFLLTSGGERKCEYKQIIIKSLDPLGQRKHSYERSWTIPRFQLFKLHQ